MATANLTVRVDEGVKREFDSFCENVGINPTSAINMFIRTVLRNRALPFIVTDSTAEEQNNQIILTRMKNAVQAMREQSMANGNADMSLDEINAEIAACRQERRRKNA